MNTREFAFDQVPVINYFTQAMERETSSIAEDRLRLGIVDDQKATISSLSSIFSYSKKIDVTLTARSGQELFGKLKETRHEDLPHIIITDVNMPGMSGIDVVRHGKAIFPGIHFVMLTVFDDEDTLFQAIQAGASGYLLKGEKASVIQSHIERFLEDGATPMSPPMARKALEILAHVPKPVSGSDIIEFEGLSSREKDVLYLLVDGLDYKEIAVRLSISPNTVRTHISNVYQKLQITSKAQAIRLVQGHKGRVDHNTSVKRIKILLVDDHRMILDSLSMMLSAVPDFEVVGTLSDPTLADAFLQQHQVDLMVTDIHMPKLNGMQLTRQVKDHHPEVKILVLTVSEDLDQIQEARQSGVNGYVFKKANREELTRALRAIASGQNFFSGDTALPKQAV
jgi:DNA-binding NarL/FixJ family response regulator